MTLPKFYGVEFEYEHDAINLGNLLIRRGVFCKITERTVPHPAHVGYQHMYEVSMFEEWLTDVMRGLAYESRKMGDPASWARTGTPWMRMRDEMLRIYWTPEERVQLEALWRLGGCGAFGEIWYKVGAEMAKRDEPRVALLKESLRGGEVTIPRDVWYDLQGTSVSCRSCVAGGRHRCPVHGGP